MQTPILELPDAATGKTRHVLAWHVRAFGEISDAIGTRIEFHNGETFDTSLPVADVLERVKACITSAQ